MKISEHSLNLLTILKAKFFKGIGPAWVINHLDLLYSTESIISTLNESRKSPSDPLVTIEQFNNAKNLIAQTINKMGNAIDGVISVADDNFPVYRGNVPPSKIPVILFYKGNLALLNSNNVAVIGLLNPDSNTIEKEKLFVQALVKKGFTIISGLALGCDSIAHQETLLHQGKTVAILPSPLTDIIPYANKKLANEIVQNNGLLISEYYTEAKYVQERNGRYEERDRLQAIFSDGIILTASYAKNNMGNDSGSRLAMEYARKYGIPRAVLSDNGEESNSKYDLNRQIMAEIPAPFIIDIANSFDALESFTKKIKFTTKNPSLKKDSLFGNF